MYNIEEEIGIASSDNFTVVLSTNPLAAALTLGNIYHYIGSQAQIDGRITAAIDSAKRKLSRAHILQFCAMIDNADRFNWSEMAEGSKGSLLALRQHMIRDIDYFRQMENTVLISYGQQQTLSREIFIALIRKHLDSNRFADPFLRDDFSYELLSVGDVDQNNRYLYPFIVQCPSLCVDDIVALGRQDPEIARIILRDLSTSTYLFEVSAQLALIHPTLRNTIAEMWNNFIASHPLTTEQEIALQGLINQLSTICPEFSQVRLHTRPVSIQQRGENQPPQTSWWYYLAAGAMLGPLAYVASVPTLICIGQGLSAPILPLLMTSAAGMGITSFTQGRNQPPQPINEATTTIPRL